MRWRTSLSRTSGKSSASGAANGRVAMMSSVARCHGDCPGAMMPWGAAASISSCTFSMNASRRSTTVSALGSAASAVVRMPTLDSTSVHTNRSNRLQVNSGPLQAVTQNDLVGQLLQLQDGAHKLATELSDPNAQYRSGVDQATEASKTLADGLKRLQDGSGTLLAGVTTLKDGTGKLVVAASTATDATSRLAAGSSQLVVGWAT